MTAHIGDTIMMMSRTLRQPAREGEIREVRAGPGGVVYLVRWSDTGSESLLRPDSDVMIKNVHARWGVPAAGDGVARLGWLFHPLAWRHRRELQREQQDRDEWLAWRVEQILAGLGLTHIAFTVGAGRVVHIPEVISVIAGPPVGLDIRILPGQTPDQFAAHAPAIAYNLGVPQVRIVPVGPTRIRVDLLSQDLLVGAPPGGR